MTPAIYERMVRVLAAMLAAGLALPLAPATGV